MELEKKKETQWAIKKNNDPNKVIYFKAIEESGIIVKICIGIQELEKELTFETNPEEFKNLYAIFKSFRDLLYSEGLDILHEAIKQDEPINSLKINNDINLEDSINSITEKELENLKKIKFSEEEEFKEEHIEIPINEEIPIEDVEKRDEILEELNEIPKDEKTQEILKAIDEIQIEQDKIKKEISNKENSTIISNRKEKNNTEKLDPTEWDPW